MKHNYMQLHHNIHVTVVSQMAGLAVLKASCCLWV